MAIRKPAKHGQKAKSTTPKPLPLAKPGPLGPLPSLDAKPLTQEDMLLLQRSAGNRAVGQLLEGATQYQPVFQTKRLAEAPSAPAKPGSGSAVLTLGERPRLGDLQMKPLQPMLSKGGDSTWASGRRQKSVIQRESSLTDARDKHLKDIDVAAGVQRFELLKELKKRSPSFDKVADGLHGWDATASKKLQDAVKEKFTEPFQLAYLESIIKSKGEKPSHVMRLALSLGLVKSGAGDKKEVLRIIEDEPWSQADKVEYNAHKASLEARLQSTFNALTLQRVQAFLTANEAVATAATGDAAAGQQAAEKEVLYLAASIKQCYGRWQWASTQNNKVFETVKKWLTKASTEARALAQNDLAQADSEVAKALKYVGLATGRHREYVQDLINGVINGVELQAVLGKDGAGKNITLADTQKSKSSWQLEQEFLPAAEQAASQAKEQKVAEANANLVAANTLTALLGREKKEQQKWDGRYRVTKWFVSRSEHTELRTHLAAMTPAQKKAFFATLGNDEKKLTTSLQDAGLKADEVAGLVEQFNLATKDQAAGPNYIELTKLVAELPAKAKRTSKTRKTFSEKAFGLVTKMTKEEREFAEKNPAVKDALQDAGNDAKNAAGPQIKAINTLIDPNQQDLKAISLDNLVARWAILIGAEIAEHATAGGHVYRHTVKRGKVVELLQHAQMEAQTAIGANVGFGTLKDFGTKVLAHADLQKYSSFLWGSWWGLEAHGALTSKFKQGDLINAADRLRFARRGFATRTTEMTQIIEDSSGEQLFSVAEPVNRAKDAYDLKADVLTTMTKELGGMGGGRSKSLVKVLAKARYKLGDYIITAADQLNIKDDNNQKFASADVKRIGERTKALGLLDEEDMSRKGVQWSSLSVAGYEQAESARAFKGAHRAMGNALRDLGAHASAKNRADTIENRLGNIRATASEWTSRAEAFDALKAKYDGRCMLLVELLLGAAIGVSTGFLTGGATWLAAAFIKFGMAMMQKVATTVIRRYVVGETGLTRGQMAQALAQSLVEMGLAVATADFAEHVTKPLWQEATLVKDVDGKFGSKLAQDWYKSGGLYTTQGIFTEAGKNAAETMVGKVLFSAPAQIFADLTTSEEVLKTLRENPGDAMKYYMRTLVEAGLLTSVQTLVREGMRDAWDKDAREKQGKASKDYHDKLQAEADAKATLGGQSQDRKTAWDAWQTNSNRETPEKLVENATTQKNDAETAKGFVTGTYYTERQELTKVQTAASKDGTFWDKVKAAKQSNEAAEVTWARDNKFTSSGGVTTRMQTIEATDGYKAWDRVGKPADAPAAESLLNGANTQLTNANNIQAYNTAFTSHETAASNLTSSKTDFDKAYASPIYNHDKKDGSEFWAAYGAALDPSKPRLMGGFIEIGIDKLGAQLGATPPSSGTTAVGAKQPEGTPPVHGTSNYDLAGKNALLKGYQAALKVKVNAIDDPAAAKTHLTADLKGKYTEADKVDFVALANPNTKATDLDAARDKLKAAETSVTDYVRAFKAFNGLPEFAGYQTKRTEIGTAQDKLKAWEDDKVVLGAGAKLAQLRALRNKEVKKLTDAGLPDVLQIDATLGQFQAKVLGDKGDAGLKLELANQLKTVRDAETAAQQIVANGVIPLPTAQGVGGLIQGSIKTIEDFALNIAALEKEYAAAEKIVNETPTQFTNALKAAAKQYANDFKQGLSSDPRVQQLENKLQDARFRRAKVMWDKVKGESDALGDALVNKAQAVQVDEAKSELTNLQPMLDAVTAIVNFNARLDLKAIEKQMEEALVNRQRWTKAVHKVRVENLVRRIGQALQPAAQPESTR